MVRRSITAFRGLVIGCIAISSAIVAAQNPGGSPEARNMKNPVPPTAASIKMGAQLYQKNCEFCHGPKGLGDGRFKMKGVKGRLSDTDKWHLVNYIRSLAPENTER